MALNGSQIALTRWVWENTVSAGFFGVCQNGTARGKRGYEGLPQRNPLALSQGHPREDVSRHGEGS